MASLPVNTYIQTMCLRLFNDPGRDIYIEVATDRTSLDFFGPDFYNYAIALRAMHDYMIDKSRKYGDGGFITDKTEGRLTVRYLHNMNKSSRSTLLMTEYGQKLHELIRARGPIIGVAPPSCDGDDGYFVGTEG
jgi:hypothetical protein